MGALNLVFLREFPGRREDDECFVGEVVDKL